MLFSGKAVSLDQEPEDKGRAQLVQDLAKWCKEEREFWRPIFNRIRTEQKFAAGKHWPKEYSCQSESLEPFVGDVIQQMINRKVASLYAKNPTPEAKSREKLLFEFWDESQESLRGAQEIMKAAAPMLAEAQAAIVAGAMPNVPPPPEIEIAQQIMQDYERGMAEKAMLQKIARTASLLLKHEWDSQSPEFVVSMKQLVTRILTSRVGFIKVMYRREMQPTEAAADPTSLTDKLASLKSRLEKMSGPGFDPESSEAEETRQMMKELAATPDEQAGEEGLVYDFLSATSIIIDRRCRCMREFVGAHRIAHEMMETIEDVEAKYGVNLENAGAVLYDESGELKDSKYRTNDEEKKDRVKVCVWHIEDRDTGLCYVICDGVKDFLKEPYENRPTVSRFWSIVPVVFNAQEVECNEPEIDVTIYPRSDVRLAMPMQLDINTAGEGLREHRVANRPAWVVDGNKMVEGDLAKLASPRPAHTALRFQSLADGVDINKLIQPLPTKAITPELYDTGGSNLAMLLATGMQMSDLGNQGAGETATGQSIAESSKISSINSNVDDLEFCLSILAQMSWEMLIQEMPEVTVKKIVGRGAVWPTLSRNDIKQEIYLQIEAGTSGKPNQALELQKAREAIPLLIQMMMQEGKSLTPLIKWLGRISDSSIDVDELLKPSQLQLPQQVMPQNPNMPTPKPVQPMSTPQPFAPGEQAQNTRFAMPTEQTV